jgi:hypothetical protein
MGCRACSRKRSTASKKMTAKKTTIKLKGRGNLRKRK